MNFKVAASEQVKDNTPTLTEFEMIHELISGRAYAAAVYVAAKLGLADLLASGPKTVGELAKMLDVNENALYRLLRALASIGIFKEEGKEFTMTRLASTLRSDIPNSIRGLAIMCGSDWHWQTWGGLLYTIKTGKPFFPEHFGKEFFPYIKENSEASEEFNGGMTSLSSLNNYVIADQYDFSNAQVVVDVGGGQGGLLCAVLKFNPKIQGILLDLPSVAEAARSLWLQDEVSARLRIEGGDFFNTVPVGGDIYILKHVLHGLDHEQSLKLLKTIMHAMPSHGKLLIIEMIIPEKNQPCYSKFNDLGMLLLSGRGQEREQHEFENIIADSGLEITHMFPAHFGVCVIETQRKK